MLAVQEMGSYIPVQHWCIPPYLLQFT